MNISKVLNAWADGKAGSTANGSLSTDGDNLYSYELRIGKTVWTEFDPFEHGTLIIGDFTASGKYYSQTTSTHVNRAWRETGAQLVDTSAI